MSNAEIKHNLENIKKLLDIENTEKDNTEELYEDILKKKLWGIHITSKNEALSDDDPYICIGWSKMGDMSSLYYPEDFIKIYEEQYHKDVYSKDRDVGQIYRFVHEIKVGDYVIFAESKEFHIGRVETDYYYDLSSINQDINYTNYRKVKWLKKNISLNVISKEVCNALSVDLSVFCLNDYRSVIYDLLNGKYEKNNNYMIGINGVILNYDPAINIPYERNRIIFGAPGTGKSYRIKKDSDEVVTKYNGEFERVTFHPDYTYSQFVGSYKPVMDAGGEQIKYEYVPGPFIRVLVNALRSTLEGRPKPYILIIEEINRAKVASVFGDVFQLLDRDDTGVSEYEIQVSEDIRKYLSKSEVLGGKPDNYKNLKIPSNMYIWATMNSADQGVYPMDTAFKRRWNFEYIGIDDGEEKVKDKCFVDIPGESEKIEWNALRKAINDKMSSRDFKINEDKLIGPYFISRQIIVNGNSDEFIKVFTSKIIMYLYEDAVKQRKNRFFEGCPDTSKYSSICDYFQTNGLEIFGESFKKDFYDKNRG